MDRMRVCVVGLGAVGGLVASRLHSAGVAEVVGLARGDKPAMISRDGLRVRAKGLEEIAVPLRVVGTAAECGAQDVVIICLKGQDLPAAAAGLRPLLSDATTILPLINGVPWWFCPTLDTALDTGPLTSIDPDGRVAGSLPIAQVVGSVVHFSATTPAPGIVSLAAGTRLILGEPCARTTLRLVALHELLSAAGFDVELSSEIHCDVWYKLLGNMCLNPISALTGATMGRIAGDCHVRDFAVATMEEAARIGELLGLTMRASAQERIELAGELGDFRTSMLQDLDAGRPLEVEALIGAVVELADALAVPAPATKALYGLVRLLDASRRTAIMARPPARAS